MGKSNKKSKAKSQPKNTNDKYPLVSICTPTFNRRPFIETMFQCFRNQDYPKERMEWIIVDDGTDKIEDLILSSNIPQIKYYKLNKKLYLGAKRNYMHKHAKGSIIVYMDDDDYYPPDRVSHAVEKLQSDPNALCAGSSEIYVYFKTLNKMIQCGPYHGTHATAGTFAFKRELLNQTQYEESAAIAEERAFLKGYTIPFVQLDPLKTILVFSHDHNTFDKKRMFDGNPDPNYFKESEKTVDMFIKNNNEKNIKQFFLNDIDELLSAYKDGLPIMKPDVLKQIKEIEAEREKEKQEAIARLQHTNITIQQEGHPPRKLTTNEVIALIQNQQKEIQQLKSKGIMTETANGEKRMLSLEEIVSIITELKENMKIKIKENESLKSTIAKINGNETIINEEKDKNIIINDLKEKLNKVSEEREILQNYNKELQDDFIKLTETVKSLTNKKK